MHFEDCILEVTRKQLLDTWTNTQGKLEVLLKWKHLLKAENGWKSATRINKEFSEFHLHGGGINWFHIV